MIVTGEYLVRIRKLNAGLSTYNFIGRDDLVPTANLAINNSGTIFISDHDNKVVYRMSESGDKYVMIGRFGVSGDIASDGIFLTGADARVISGHALCVDSSDTLFLCDQNAVKMIRGGRCQTVAGQAGVSGDISNQSNGLLSRFNAPMGICVNRSGVVYVSDTGNNKIKKVFPGGLVVSIAGSSSSGFVNGQGSDAQFSIPWGIACDASGNLYVADYGNNRIRKISDNGIVTTLAGNGDAGSVDGVGTEASFDGPKYLSLDPSGNFMYVVERERVRKVYLNGNTSTLDQYTTPTSGFGDIAVDRSGTIYVLENTYSDEPTDRILLYVESTITDGNTMDFDGPSLTDLDITWKKPSGTTFNGRGDNYDINFWQNFDETGVYTITCTDWNKVKGIVSTGSKVILIEHLPNAIIANLDTEFTISLAGIWDARNLKLPSLLNKMSLWGERISGNVNNWNIPTGLVEFRLSHLDSASGDIGIILPNLTNLSILDISSSLGLVGNISSFSLPSSMTSITLDQLMLTGSIEGWVFPSGLADITVREMDVVGDITGWVMPSSLGLIDLYRTNASGDISGWTLGSGLYSLNLCNTDVNGDISGWIFGSSFDYLDMQATNVSGDITGWSIPTISYLNLSGTGISYGSTGGTLFSTARPSFIDMSNCGFSESEVDNVLADIVADPSWAYGVLNLDGTNAAPSLTGLENKTILESRGWSVAITYSDIPNEIWTYVIPSGSNVGYFDGASLVDADMTWTKPSLATFDGKNPAGTNFDEEGIYKLSCSDWSKVTTVSLGSDASIAFGLISNAVISSAVNLEIYSGRWNATNFQFPSSATYVNIASSYGTLVNWALPSGLNQFSFSNSEMNGNIESIIPSSGTTDFNLYDSFSLTGNISNMIIPSTMSNLNIVNIYNADSDITNFVLPSSIGTLSFSGTPVVGSVTNWSFPSSLNALRLDDTGINGDITGWVLPTYCGELRLTNDSNIFGDISVWSNPNMAEMRINGTGVSYDSTGGLFSTTSSIYLLWMQDCNLTSTHVDNILVDLAASSAAVEVDVSGTNQPPTATGLAAKATIEGNGGIVTTS